MMIEQAITRLKRLVEEKKKGKENIVVLIAGYSGGGKTFLSQKIKEQFKGEVLVFSLDNYYIGKSGLKKLAEETGEVLTFDHPQAIDLKQFRKDLEILKDNRKVKAPVYDFAVSERRGEQEIKPKKIILVEGIFALQPGVRGVRAFEFAG